MREKLPKVRDGLKHLCAASCPRCRATCMFKDGHEDKHDCYHQPKGLFGIVWEKTDELVQTNCLESVEEDHTITNIGLYTDFEKHYPEWKKPNLSLLGPNGEFRQMFFSRFQKELAGYYGKKECSSITTYCDIASLKNKLTSLAEG